jgi:hypothetical protein
VEAFHLLQAQLAELTRRAGSQGPLIEQMMGLAFAHLDHPLTTVAAISKSILRKILSAAAAGGSELLKARLNLLESLSSAKGGYKSRYLALNLMVDYLEPFSYLAEHPHTVKEIIDSTVESVSSGKYVLNFFETFLKKALTSASKDSEKRWFDIWIDEYLRALRS